MSCLGLANTEVLKHCKSKSHIKCIYIVNSSDCVFKGGIFIRMKRKYGKFKREVYTN